MTDVAIICAHNPGKRNLGMYTVDLSARDFFSKSSNSYDLIKLVGNRRVGALSYRKVASFSQLWKYKTVIYWGDFQQNPIWGESNFALRTKRETRGISLDEARTSWWHNCLLEGVDIPEGQRVYSVGTCFLGCNSFFDSASDLERYRASLSRFQGIIPRDIESCRILQEDLGLENVIPGGFDCACLREPVAVKQNGSGDYFTYTMRRTIKDQGLIQQIVSEVEQQTGLRGVPVRWLRSKHAKYKPGGLHRYFEKCVRTIKEGKFLLTDIYHATINAVSEGVPVVCIGDGSTVFRDTCDDVKKGYLFKMLNSESSYLPIDVDNIDFALVGRTAASLSSLSNNPQQEMAVEIRARFMQILKQLPGLEGLS